MKFPFKLKRKVSALLIDYKNNYNDYQNDPFIDRIDINLISTIENKKDKALLSEVEKLRDYLSNTTDISFNENKLNLFTTYNEIANVWYLHNKGVDIEKINERKQKGISTPDFCIRQGKNKNFVELKTPIFINHLENYKDMVEVSFDAKIDGYNQRKNGRNIIITEYAVNPYHSNSGDYTYDMLSTLIKHINNQIKPSQIKKENDRNKYSFLLIDLRLLPPICSKGSFMKPMFDAFDERRKNTFQVTNQLWFTAFGKIDQDVIVKKDASQWYPLNEELWEPKKSENNGILIDYKYLDGLLFQIESLDNSSFTYLGYSIHNKANIKCLFDLMCDGYIIYDPDNNIVKTKKDY